MPTNYAPCPKCGASNSEICRATWWGGVLGPRLLTHVKCPDCGKKYNGKTGKENTVAIIVYFVVIGGLAFVATYWIFFGIKAF